MAEGLAKAFGPKSWEFKSAGTIPSGVNPHTIESLREIGIDISAQTSKRVDEEMVSWADHIITLCDSAKACVTIPSSKKATHWSIPDPVGTVGDETRILKSFAKTRDIIRGHLEEFFNFYTPPHPDPHAMPAWRGLPKGRGDLLRCKYII